MKKPTHKKNTLLKNAQANAESNFYKRVFFYATQEEFFTTLFFLIFFRHRTTTDTANLPRHSYKCKSPLTTFHTDIGRQFFGQKRRASANSTYKKLAVQWLNDPDSYRDCASYQVLCWQTV